MDDVLRGTAIEFAPVPTPLEVPDLAPGAKPLRMCKQAKSYVEWEYAQCCCQSFFLCFLDPPQLLPPLIVRLRLLALVPVDVLVLLPSSGRRIDAVT